MSKDRIWICEECNFIAGITEKIENEVQSEGKWGRICKAHPRSKKEWRCEAYWKEYKEVDKRTRTPCPPPIPQPAQEISHDTQG